MNNQDERIYIYLDDERERRRLIQEVERVRRTALDLVQSLPEDQWYKPRYHGWTPAAMLGHLNFTDNRCMFFVKAALVGFRPAMGIRTVNRLNNLTSGLFRKRLVSASVRGIEHNQAIITNLIGELPIDKFSAQVYSPYVESYTTVEKAIQDFFVYHWQEHIQTMREAEGIKPPEQTDKN